MGQVHAAVRPRRSTGGCAFFRCITSRIAGLRLRRNLRVKQAETERHERRGALGADSGGFGLGRGFDGGVIQPGLVDQAGAGLHEKFATAPGQRRILLRGRNALRLLTRDNRQGGSAAQRGVFIGGQRARPGGGWFRPGGHRSEGKTKSEQGAENHAGVIARQI